jgi:hypothetical protein
MEKRKPGRPKGSSNKKLTKTEQEAWIKESIKKIMGEHLSYKDYVNWSYKNGFSASRANENWKTCWDTIRDKYELDKNKQVSKHLMNYWKIYDEARFKGDLTNARQTLDAIAKMMGLNEPDRLDMNASGEITFKFGDE